MRHEDAHRPSVASACETTNNERASAGASVVAQGEGRRHRAGRPRPAYPDSGRDTESHASQRRQPGPRRCDRVVAGRRIWECTGFCCAGADDHRHARLLRLAHRDVPARREPSVIRGAARIWPALHGPAQGRNVPGDMGAPSTTDPLRELRRCCTGPDDVHSIGWACAKLRCARSAVQNDGRSACQSTVIGHPRTASPGDV